MPARNLAEYRLLIAHAGPDRSTNSLLIDRFPWRCAVHVRYRHMLPKACLARCKGPSLAYPRSHQVERGR